MKLKLDAKTIAHLTLDDDEPERFVWDTELAGFGYRMRRRRDGSVLRTFTAQYRSDGHTRRHTWPTEKVVAVAKVREAARKILAGATLGYDPQSERRSKRARAARTFRSVVDAYLAARHDALRASSLRVAKLYLTGPYFRPLHVSGVAEITHADLAACLSTIARRHSPTTAAAARRTVFGLFKWAMQEGWLPVNPAIATRQGAVPKPRDRVLSGAELVAIWRACGDDDFGRIVKLLILLGSRRAEVGGMCWAELELYSGTWTLPAVRSKNHRAHKVTLPPGAVAIIDSVPRRACDQLFGSLWGKHRGFESWGRAKAELDARLPDFQPWTLHDLRRTVATGMIDLGIEPHHVEAVLNHFSGHRGGVAGTYNRSPYEQAIKTALLRWSAHVDDLLTGRDTNVAALRA